MLSLWNVAFDLIAADVHHLVWTHTDGYYSVDQLQYLAWVRAASQHGLITDLYVLRPTPADYLQPAIALSGLLVRLGMAPWLALMLWKPVAIVAIFLAARALVYHCLSSSFDRRVALVLALLFASITDAHGTFGIFGDMVSVWQTWGYPFGLIGVGLIVWALLGYARAREAGRVSTVPGLLGLLAGIVHPWQAELMFVLLALAELIRLPEHRARLAGRGGIVRGGLGDPGLRLAVLTLALVAIALAYYFALGHLDPVWRAGQSQARHSFDSRAALIAAAPLLAFALLGYRGRPADFVELCLRMWIPAAVILWLFALTSLGATPQHAVNGLPLPMAVLAVLGAHRTGLDRLAHARALVGVGVAIAVVPGTAYMLADAHTFTAPAPGNANFITPSEQQALAALRRDPTPGGVLTEGYLGKVVPGLTGRHTYVGDCLWSEPDCPTRERLVGELLSGALSPRAAVRFVSATGARFVLGDCLHPPGPATRSLAGLVASTQRIGCATIWRLHGGQGASAGS